MKTFINKILFLTTLSLFLCISVFPQNDYLQEGVSLFKEGKYKEAQKILKKIEKQNAKAYLANYYIGLSYEKREKYEKALDAFKESISLNPIFAEAKTGLAYMYIKVGKYGDAAKTAEDVVRLNAANYQTYYILGLAYTKLGNTAEAIKNLDKLIALRPNFANAYLMRYNNTKYNADDEVLLKPDEYQGKFTEKRDFFRKYINLLANSNTNGLTETDKRSVRFFDSFYKKQEFNQKDDKTDSNETTRIKILSKPGPGYTDRARSSGVGGAIRILVAFQSNGKIEHTFIIQGLGYGLDKNAIKAVKKIKFTPATRNGKPITVVKTIIYNFRIY